MARDFTSASSQYMTRAAVITARPFTLAAWVKADAVTAAVNRAVVAVYKLGVTAGGSWDLLYLTTTGTVRADAWDGTTNPRAETVATVSAGAWHHVCGVFADSARSVFLDGANKVTESTAISALTGIDQCSIGGWNLSGSFSSFFDGLIAEPAIWNGP